MRQHVGVHSLQTSRIMGTQLAFECHTKLPVILVGGVYRDFR